MKQSLKLLLWLLAVALAALIARQTVVGLNEPPEPPPPEPEPCLEGINCTNCIISLSVSGWVVGVTSHKS
jgi:hypothetical protein